MSEIPQRQPENLTNTERRIELMKPLFSENTTITAISEMDFQVETVLDQDICDGGQKVKLRLTLEREKLKPSKSPMDPRLEIKPYVCFLVNTFEVNGEDLVSEGTPIYLTSQRDPEYKLELLSDEDKKIIEGIKEESENALFFEEDEFITNGSGIALLKMKSGNDLASFFHEKGHTLRQNDDLDINDVLQFKQQIRDKEFARKDLVYSRFGKKISGLYGKPQPTTSLDEKISVLTGEISELYRKRIFDERKASIKALELLKSHPNIFPKDTNNVRTKLFYSALLSTYISETELYDDSLKRDATQIVDFDQDWHY